MFILHIVALLDINKKFIVQVLGIFYVRIVYWLSTIKLWLYS